MREFTEIIEDIKKQTVLNPPDSLTDKVMDGIYKTEGRFEYKIYRFLFQRRKLSSDAAGILSGRIVSAKQCAYLLFTVGVFYFLVGSFVIWGMKDIWTIDNINVWLKAQLYMVIISAVILMLLAVIVWKITNAIIYAKYAIVLHTIFIALDAVVIQFILISPQVILFTMMFIAAAIVFSVMLISNINSYIKEAYTFSDNKFA